MIDEMSSDQLVGNFSLHDRVMLRVFQELRERKSTEDNKSESYLEVNVGKNLQLADRALEIVDIIVATLRSKGDREYLRVFSILPLSKSTNLVLNAIESMNTRKSEKLRISDINGAFADTRFARNNVSNEQRSVEMQLAGATKRDFSLRHLVKRLGQYEKVSEKVKVESLFSKDFDISYEQDSELEPMFTVDSQVATDHGSYTEIFAGDTIDKVFSGSENDVIDQTARFVFTQMQFRKEIEAGRVLSQFTELKTDESKLAFLESFVNQVGSKAEKNEYKLYAIHNVTEELLGLYDRLASRIKEYRQSSPPKILGENFTIALAMGNKIIPIPISIDLTRYPNLLVDFYGGAEGKFGKTDPEKQRKAQRIVFQHIRDSIGKGVLSQKAIEIFPKDIDACYASVTNETVKKNTKTQTPHYDLMMVVPLRTDKPGDHLPLQLNYLLQDPNRPIGAVGTLYVSGDESNENQATENISHQLEVQFPHPIVDGKLAQDAYKRVLEQNTVNNISTEVFSSVGAFTDVKLEEDIQSESQSESQWSVRVDRPRISSDEISNQIGIDRNKVVQLKEHLPDSSVQFSLPKSWNDEISTKLKDANTALSEYFQKTFKFSKEELAKLKYVFNTDLLLTYSFGIYQNLYTPKACTKMDYVMIAEDGRMELPMVAIPTKENQPQLLQIYKAAIESGSFTPSADRGKMIADILGCTAKERLLPISINIILSWLAYTLGEKFQSVLENLAKKGMDIERSKYVVKGNGGLISRLGKLAGFRTASIEYHNGNLCVGICEKANGDKQFDMRGLKQNMKEIQSRTDVGDDIQKLANFLSQDIQAFVETKR